MIIIIILILILLVLLYNTDPDVRYYFDIITYLPNKKKVDIEILSFNKP